MRRFAAIPTLLVILALAAPAAAEEIIYLKSGATMPIVSHKIDGTMIHVDLGDNAFMAFPLSAVDRVEAAGANVMLRKSNTGGTNVMQPRPDPTGSHPVQAMTGRKRPRGQDKPPEPEGRSDGTIGVDGNGVAVYRPLAHSAHPGKRDSAAAGHGRVRTGGAPGGYKGSTRVGTRQVMKPPSNPDPRPKLTGIEAQPNTGSRHKTKTTAAGNNKTKPVGKGD